MFDTAELSIVISCNRHVPGYKQFHLKQHFKAYRYRNCYIALWGSPIL